MRLIADENVHPTVVRRLRGQGFEVEWSAGSAPGVSDEAILSRPDIGQATLITYDRDFSGLVFGKGYAAPRVILYARLGRADPDHAADRILALLKNGLLDHHIISIGRDGDRFAPFPDGAKDG